MNRFSFFILMGSMFVSPVKTESQNQSSDFEELFEFPNDSVLVIDDTNRHLYSHPSFSYERTETPDTQIRTVDEKGSRNCSCVLYFLCNNTDVPISLSTYNGGCDFLEVCCSKDEQVESPIIPPSVEKMWPPSSREGRCGFRHPNGAGSGIIGRNVNEAKFGEFPWMVMVMRLADPSSKVYIYKCGGALIHPQMVITAAHCVKKNQTLKIRAGDWNRITKVIKETYPHQEREVQNIVIHPNSSSEANNIRNDIAILYLKRSLKIAKNVDTIICLPPQGAFISPDICYATGWAGVDILKKIDLPVVPRSECEEASRLLSSSFELHKSMICAGGRGKDTCGGDSGSPLVCPIPGRRDRYYLAGIVSMGFSCEFKVPGQYVNLPLFREWIDNQMISFGLNTSTYQY